MNGKRIDDNAVLSALKGGNLTSKTLRFGRLKVYKGWEDEIYTRARATFEAEDGKQVSFFVHIGPSDLKIWLDSSNKPLPDHTINGAFHTT